MRIDSMETPGLAALIDSAFERRAEIAPSQVPTELVAALDKSNIALDRKILSDLAISDPAAFKKVVETARAA